MSVDLARGKTYVVAVEVVDGDLGEHGVVLKLGLAQRRAVTGNEDQLGLARAEGLHGGLGTHGNWRYVNIDALNFQAGIWEKLTLAGLHDEGQAGGEGVTGLLGLGHCDGWRGVLRCLGEVGDSTRMKR
jgi:hypothetical protein